MFGNGRGGGDHGMTATGSHHGPFSLLGSDVVVTGNISASVDLHVDGRIDGDVSCAALVQGADSVIHGNIDARTARIAGTVEGSVTAEELIIEPGARIIGDCRYGTLTVAAGAVVEGRFQLRTVPGPELKVVGAD